MPPERIAIMVAAVAAMGGALAWALDVSYEWGLLEGRLSRLEGAVERLVDYVMGQRPGDHHPPMSVPRM